jgi:adenylate cyclase
MGQRGFPVSPERVERKLAAILAADVAGYSRLMGADEEGTLSVLKAHRRELIDPKIAEHRGRVVKTTGDGMLVEFASVLDALRCAVEVQRGMAERNAGVAPEKRIEFRVGINVGDIIIDGDDIFGDGVNIAARLEGLADPGSICVSGRVYEDVRGKLDIAFDDMGEQPLKNIAWPVRVFRALMGTLAAAARPALALPDKPSIGVLPFQNMSGDPEQEYFVDGMVEEIITALSRIRWLFVIARNSSFIYKGRPVDVKQVGRELGVRYVLEGSVRKGGTRVRITGQLIDAETGAHLWADRFDGSLEDVFELQDKVASSVVGIIEPALAAAEQQRVLRKPPERLGAWEAYQRGLWHFYKYGPEENAAAQALFRRAIEIDPNFAPGHYGIALAQHWEFWVYSTRPWDEVAGSGLEEARLGVLLDDKDPMAHAILALMWQLVGEWEACLAEGRAAVDLNPNSVWSLMAMGHSFGWGGHPREGIDYLRRAVRMSPHDPLNWFYSFWIGIFQYFAGAYAESAETMRNVARVPPGPASREVTHYPTRWLAQALAQLGRIEEAKEELGKAVAFSPVFFRRITHQRPPWMRPEDYARVLDGLRKAGWEG